MPNWAPWQISVKLAYHYVCIRTLYCETSVVLSVLIVVNCVYFVVVC